MLKKAGFLILIVFIYLNSISSIVYATPINQAPVMQQPDDGWLETLVKDGMTAMLNQMATDITNKSMTYLGKTMFSDKKFITPALKKAWYENLGIGYGLMLLLFLIGVASSSLRDHLNIELFSLREVMTRVVLAVIAIKFSLDIATLLLDISSGFCQSILGKGVTFSDINAGITPAAEGTSLMGVALMYLALAILILVLGVVYAIRDATIWYFIAYAPVFIVLWVIPQTQKYAKISFNILIGMIGIKFIHVGMLKVFLLMQTKGSSYEVFQSLAIVIMMYAVPGILLGIAINSGLGQAARTITSTATSTIVSKSVAKPTPK